MKKICIVSTSRADLGQLSELIKIFQKNKTIEFKFLVTGLHLNILSNFSYKETTNYGIKIDKKIPIKFKDFKNNGINNYLSTLIKKISNFLFKFKPDLIVLLGDRYDTLGCAIASYFNNIPIVHLHGGEITKGSKDESIRHAITKLSTYHFPANEIFARRLIKMGENPRNIFIYGSLGIDKIKKIKFTKKKLLQKKLKVKFKEKKILITMHPEFDAKSTKALIDNFFKVIKKYRGVQKFICSPNADANSDYIRAKISKYLKQDNDSYYFENIGFVDYLSLSKFCNFVIGNSSSGITEMPALGVYSLNIGNRQLGRPLAKSVILAKNNKKDLDEKIDFMFNKKKKNIYNQKLYYYANNTTLKIYKKIITLTKYKYLNKYFYENN